MIRDEALEIVRSVRYGLCLRGEILDMYGPGDAVKVIERARAIPDSVIMAQTYSVRDTHHDKTGPWIKVFG